MVAPAWVSWRAGEDPCCTKQLLRRAEAFARMKAVVPRTLSKALMTPSEEIFVTAPLAGLMLYSGI